MINSTGVLNERAFKQYNGQVITLPLQYITCACLVGLGWHYVIHFETVYRSAMTLGCCTNSWLWSSALQICGWDPDGLVTYM